MDENVKKLRESVSGLSQLIKELIEGEACDHSVGICYCHHYARLDEAEEILKATDGL